MTARPLRVPGFTSNLKVISGNRSRRPALAPWVVISIVIVAAFLAVVGARTALDRTAFELAELSGAIAQQASVNQRLRIDIAEMENPARIAPLAEELGLVIPTHHEQLLVEGIGRDDGIIDPDYVALGQERSTARESAEGGDLVIASDAPGPSS